MAILQALERKRVAMRILNLGGNRFIGTSVLTASI
jgi:hypothetical protein